LRCFSDGSGAGDLLANDDFWSALDDKSVELRPEVSLVIDPSPASG
jgi:hypothetical protein